MTHELIAVDSDLALAVLCKEHSSELYRLISENRDHLREWLPWVDDVTGTEDTSGFIAGTINQNQNGRGAHYAIVFKGAVAGVIGFHPIDWPNRNAEIGYWLGKEYSGMGLVTKSAAVLLESGFNELNLNRIEIRCAAGNTRSRSVAERLGMAYEGTLREEEWLFVRFVDHAVYSMLKRDYR